MGIKEFFDFARINILASPNDHILDPAYNIDIAFAIHNSKVAGMHPAGFVNRFGGGFGIVPVAKHYTIAPRTKFARSANRHNFVSGRIYNFNLKMRVNYSDGADPFIEGRIDL